MRAGWLFVMLLVARLAGGVESNGGEHSYVSCETTKGPLTIQVTRALSPRGADRFLELVQSKFFTDMALFRAIPNFIVQWGISGDPAVRDYWTNRGSIWDDPPRGIPVKRGTIAFAGNGFNSRDTHLFFALADQPQLGKDPWETPFAQITEETIGTIDKIYTGYGEAAPYGNGPTQDDIYQKGNTYLRTKFPMLDYILRCEVTHRATVFFYPPPPVAFLPPLRDSIRVDCSTTKGDITMRIKRHLSPRGADRFLELIASDFFTNAALFRVVPNFVVQFGLAASPEINDYWLQRGSILDDPPVHVPIKRGTIAFAGTGVDSRVMQVFIALEDQPQLGKSPWETAFGKLTDESMEVVDKFYSEYGDIPPWGNGPKQTLLRQKGNSYLKENFPKLDYINSCRIVDTPIA
eukprot:m.11014 g.11014  ORF g.11014 m.11014 type:complete len:406 (-) comp3122_c0_seq2:185-1402(-)